MELGIATVVDVMRKLRLGGFEHDKAIETTADMCELLHGQVPDEDMLRAATDIVYGKTARCADCPAMRMMGEMLDTPKPTAERERLLAEAMLWAYGWAFDRNGGWSACKPTDEFKGRADAMAGVGARIAREVLGKEWPDA